MSKKPRTKKLGVKDLLKLLGADPNEVAPVTLKEAKWQRALEGDEPPPAEMERCKESGKMCFSSESQAKTAARSRLNRGSSVSKLRTYHCEHCHHWHFSSSFFHR